MAYSYKNSKGVTYFLHSKAVTLKGGHKQVIFYFAKQAGPDAIAELPADRTVVENSRTGLPVCKKK